MTLTKRLLPPEDWHKLQPLVPYFKDGLPDSQHWIMPVVEIDGQIVASCALFDTVHWDVFNILPQYQKNPAVVRALIQLSLETMRESGVPSVHLTIAEDQPDLAAMAAEFGFVESPHRLYILAVSPGKEP